jgi:heptosyltransferase-1
VSAVPANIPPNSLLVVRLGAMGDVIHTLAAVCSLRTALPNMNIGWIIEDRWSELLCAPGATLSGPRSPQRPVVDSVHVVDTKRWRKTLLSRQTKR